MSKHTICNLPCSHFHKKDSGMEYEPKAFEIVTKAKSNYRGYNRKSSNTNFCYSFFN